MLLPSQRLWGATLCGLIYTAALLWVYGSTSLNLVVGNLAHMGIHMTGLMLALLVDVIAQQVPKKHKKVKAFGAVLNAIALAVIAGVALWQIAVGAYHHHDMDLFTGTDPHHHAEASLTAPLGGIDPSLLLTYVALLGLVLHLISFVILRGGRHDCVNVRGAYIHLRFDVALTLLTAVTGYLMHAYSLQWLDRALGPAIVLLVLYSVLEVGRHAYASYTSADTHHHH